MPVLAIYWKGYRYLTSALDRFHNCVDTWDTVVHGEKCFRNDDSASHCKCSPKSSCRTSNIDSYCSQAIYPTLIIILVAVQKSYTESSFGTIGVQSTLHFSSKPAICIASEKSPERPTFRVPRTVSDLESQDHSISDEQDSELQPTMDL